MPRLFVYGSLKRGCYNHDAFGFGDTAHFVGDGTLTGARLYDLGAYPCMVLVEDLGEVVHGELYALEDSALFTRIRAMELGAGYREVTVSVNGESASTYVYDEAPSGCPVVGGGRWPRDYA